MTSGNRVFLRGTEEFIDLQLAVMEYSRNFRCLGVSCDLEVLHFIWILRLNQRIGNSNIQVLASSTSTAIANC